MITGLDHIAIAVPNLAKAIERFVNDFGLTLSGQEDVIAEMTSTAFFPISSANIELVNPIDGAGPITKYLDKRGGGIHHLCFRSDNLDEDVSRLRSKGYQFLSDTPKMGAHDCRVIFIHPKTCDGVLIELNQPNDT